MSLIIELAGEVPSKKNSRQIISRGNRRISLPSTAYTMWENNAVAQLIKWRFNQKHYTPPNPAIVTISVYPKKHIRQDLTNQAEGVMDALVKAGVLLDDNRDVVREVTIRLGGYVENPKVVVEIREGDA
jgi:Holliday junction resolvase RusA-like endonuclease